MAKQLPPIGSDDRQVLDALLDELVVKPLLASHPELTEEDARHTAYRMLQADKIRICEGPDGFWLEVRA